MRCSYEWGSGFLCLCAGCMAVSAVQRTIWCSASASTLRNLQDVWGSVEFGRRPGRGGVANGTTDSFRLAAWCRLIKTDPDGGEMWNPGHLAGQKYDLGASICRPGMADISSGETESTAWKADVWLIRLARMEGIGRHSAVRIQDRPNKESEMGTSFGLNPLEPGI